MQVPCLVGAAGSRYRGEIVFNSDLLLKLTIVRMPFGKYKDRLLCDLPEEYIMWFHEKGFPKGELGILLATMYEIKLNGLDNLLKPLKK